MLRLKDDVSKVPQVGPKSKNLLTKIDIHTIEDLLYHFPFRYEDRSQISKIADITTEEKVTIKAKITTIKNIFTKNRKRITRGCAEDESGEIQLIWFNMHFIARNIRVGETYLIHGRVELFEKKKTFIVPDMEEFGETNIHLGRIVPIYPTTEGMTTKWLRTRINDVLNEEKAKGEFVEYLPEKIIRKHKFLPWNEAINEIHFPKNYEILEQVKARLSYEELFLELINASLLEKEWKKDAKAFPMKTAGNDLSLQTFMESLPFQLTNDQRAAIQEILEDLEKDCPMNRLLEGDVGTGKTIVAIVAAFNALQHGKSVLYMAPTEILAQQHFETFSKLLGSKKVDIHLITGATRKKAISTESEENRKGEKPMILIGTHALLYSDQKYANLGLVIIDEQHRFGVEQRARLLKSSTDQNTPHLLTMTATPIPRTLALTLYGDLNLSILKEHPNKQRQIITKVIPPSRHETIYRWIAQNNLSTFIVCPFIEASFAENLENVKAAIAEFEQLKNTFFKEKKCALIHGKMTSQEKTEAISKFRTGEVQILISTPVIEVGIDVPDADVMIIESAERYGLASLHQLRGRVGRGTKKGYCFILPSAYFKKAYSRLKYMEDTLDGLKLAELDLKLRGQGDIYGTMQHGFMNFRLANINDLAFVKVVREDVNLIAKDIEDFPNLLAFVKRRKGESAQN